MTKSSTYRGLGVGFLIAAGGATALSQVAQSLAAALWLAAGTMLGLATWMLVRAAGVQDPDRRDP